MLNASDRDCWKHCTSLAVCPGLTLRAPSWSSSHHIFVSHHGYRNHDLWEGHLWLCLSVHKQPEGSNWSWHPWSPHPVVMPLSGTGPIVPISHAPSRPHMTGGRCCRAMESSCGRWPACLSGGMPTACCPRLLGEHGEPKQTQGDSPHPCTRTSTQNDREDRCIDQRRIRILNRLRLVI